ncbi:hypothetical protein HK098_005239 [Nowakowskiella sp. JEL0407]|nr:hypothetical protein HK098_005239 [Nowakowskiella sp. JEL0407]
MTSEPPLISGIIPYVGCGIEYSKDPWKFLTAARKRYGSVVTLYMGGLRLTFILDPKLYDKVYKTSKKTLDLEHVIEKFEMRLFKMINPPDINQEFNRLHSFLRGTPMTAMSKVFKVQMDKQIVSVYNDIGIEDEDGYKTMGLYEFSRKVFFNASVKMIFGSQFDTDSMYEHFVIFDDGVPDLLSGLPELLLRKYRKAYNEMIGIMKSVSSTTTETDVSEVMLKRNGVMKDFEKSDDFFAQSNFMFLWGSQTNTLPAAFWAFAHVIGSPDLFRKVNEEISKIDQDKLPVPEDLPYLNAW